MIMVDQMRSPRWLPGSWNDWMGSNGQFNNNLENLYALYNMSHVFNNFFVCSDPCSPSRATFLTGLYPQQTFQFMNQDGSASSMPPPLQPYAQGGFPCIGDVLSQPSLNYQCTWIGKWHLSDNPQQPSTLPCNGGNTPGSNGPRAYGFGSIQNNDYNIPGPNPNSIYGNQAQTFGSFWTTVDPTTVSDYANEAGLPPGNSGQFMITGTINDMTGVTTGTATSVGPMEGGLPEVIIPNSACQVTVVCVTGLNPPLGHHP